MLRRGIGSASALRIQRYTSNRSDLRRWHVSCFYPQIHSNNRVDFRNGATHKKGAFMGAVCIFRDKARRPGRLVPAASARECVAASRRRHSCLVIAKWRGAARLKCIICPEWERKRLLQNGQMRPGRPDRERTTPHCARARGTAWDGQRVLLENRKLFSRPKA